MRMGPASRRCFSRGVKGAELVSFFEVDPVDGLETCVFLNISVHVLKRKLYRLSKLSTKWLGEDGPRYISTCSDRVTDGA